MVNKLPKTKKSILALHEAVGIVFQDADDQIIAGTVETEISFGPLNIGLTQEETKERVDEAILAMDLEKYRKKPPHYLSGGEKKRVTIADILAMHSKIILFDEPTASLDIQSTVRLESILHTLHHDNLALLIATHDIDFAYRWAERIIVLHDGKILMDANPKDVFSNVKLLEIAGLKKPTLYELAERFCQKYEIPLPLVMPTTVQAFSDILLS